MAVAVNNSAFAWNNSTTPSCAISVTGADRAMFIGLKVSNGATVSSPQVDGSPLTLIHSDTINDVYVYYYLNPTVGTRTVQASLSAGGDWAFLVTSLTGVHQSSPIGTSTNNTNTEQPSISTSVTGVTDGLVMDFAVLIVDEMDPDVGQTRYPTSAPQGDSFSGGFQSVGMSAKSGTGAVTMTWSSAFTAGDNKIVAVPFLPSGGGGGSPSGNQRLLLTGVG